MQDAGLVGAPWSSQAIQELLDRVRARAERARLRELEFQSWMFEHQVIQQEWERRLERREEEWLVLGWPLLR